MAESPVGKTAAWLSVVAGVLAVLAFFGITSVGDLERKINADKLDADACAYASKSLQDRAATDSPAPWRIHADELRHAAQTAVDGELRSLLRANATHWDTYASALEREAPTAELTIALNEGIEGGNNRWVKRCRSIGAFDD